VSILRIGVMVWSFGMAYAGIASGIRLYRASDFLVRGDRLCWAATYWGAGICACTIGLLLSLLC